MPVNLIPRDVSSELAGFNSVLIASCPVCPPMCLSTKRQRARLLKRAKDYEAALIRACDSGTELANDALKDTDCHIIQALNMDGVINATTSIHFPLTVVMERHDEPGAVGRAT